MYVSRIRSSDEISVSASGGRSMRSRSAASLTVCWKRAASRSQKMAPKLLVGRPATQTVSGKSTAHSLS